MFHARPALAALGAFGVGYVAAGGFSQGLAIIPGISVTFWPPAGIFVATLLLTPPRSWPWWAAAASAAELTCNALWFHSALPLALLYFGANALEALTAAALMRRFAGTPFRLDSLQDVIALAVFGAGVAPIVGATVIATIDTLIGKHAFLTAWRLVWLGEDSGMLVSAPLTLVLVQTWSARRQIDSARLWEAVAVTGTLMALGLLVAADVLHTPYALLPVLVWTALRFQLRGGAAALALTAVPTAEFAALGKARAPTAEAAMAAAVELQAFLAISALCTLLVAALSQQNR